MVLVCISNSKMYVKKLTKIYVKNLPSKILFFPVFSRFFSHFLSSLYRTKFAESVTSKATKGTHASKTRIFCTWVIDFAPSCVQELCMKNNTSKLSFVKAIASLDVTKAFWKFNTEVRQLREPGTLRSYAAWLCSVCTFIIHREWFDGTVRKITASTRAHWRMVLKNYTSKTNLCRQAKKSKPYLEATNKLLSLEEIQKVNQHCLEYLMNVSYDNVNEWGEIQMTKYITTLITLSQAYIGNVIYFFTT